MSSEQLVASVAIPRGPRVFLSYSVPDSLRAQVRVGCRVLVPLGRSNRRVTAYVVDLNTDKVSHELKELVDLLDEEPLFNGVRFEMFRFVSSYYHAPLGDVIRCALPNGLNVTDARMVSLTEQGGEQLAAHPILRQLIGGDRPVRRLDCAQSTLLRLERDGLVSIRYELERQKVNARYVSVVSATGEEPERPLRPGAAPHRLLDFLRDEGPQEVASLAASIPNHGSAVRRLVALGAASVEKVQVFRDPWQGSRAEDDVVPALTLEQRVSVDRICQSFNDGKFEGFLLQGVTGSGKTEVYLHVLDHVMAQGKGGIVLVPEIALTPQLAGRFRARFGDRVAVLHSGLTDGERLDQWELIRRGERSCVVGARSAVFAPLPKLGIVVVDEEHDGSFKQEDTPRYHARDLALKLGQIAACPVVLGSATPSMESLANVHRDRLTLLTLNARIQNRKMPAVTLVNLTEFPPVRPEAILSQPLIDAVNEVVSRQEQAIIFLNRRGYASSLLCRACGNVPTCPHCSVSLTYHRSRRRLACHYCGHISGVPTKCPTCKASHLELIGTGTEQVETVLGQLVPQARVARMDRDTTRGRQLQSLLQRFRAGDIDVLVGTQMVAKGHDFPRVTLVGVLLAEQMLKLPDFRAAERTFQLLTQVAGRAGRHELPGRVIVQTYTPDHHSLQCAQQHNVDSFSNHEMGQRKLRAFPPYSHLVLVRLDSIDSGAAHDAAGRVAHLIRTVNDSGQLNIDIIGPQLAPVERIKGRTRYQVLLRAATRSVLHRAINALHLADLQLGSKVRMAIDVDPINLL